MFANQTKFTMELTKFFSHENCLISDFHLLNVLIGAENVLYYFILFENFDANLKPFMSTGFSHRHIFRWSANQFVKDIVLGTLTWGGRGDDTHVNKIYSL